MLPAPCRPLHTVNPSIPALYLTASRALLFPPSPFFPPPARLPIFLLSFEILGGTMGLSTPQPALAPGSVPASGDYAHTLAGPELLWRPGMLGGENIF